MSKASPQHRQAVSQWKMPVEQEHWPKQQASIAHEAKAVPGDAADLLNAVAASISSRASGVRYQWAVPINMLSRGQLPFSPLVLISRLRAGDRENQWLSVFHR
jgi:hypothetical protein